VYVCNTVTLEMLHLECLFCCVQEHLQKVKVKFLCQGHQVKVKVTRAEQRFTQSRPIGALSEVSLACVVHRTAHR